MDLVLSVFPGIDLLGRAFEEEGFCLVRGPDVIWGGDIRSFHPPVGVFDGVIGGPPCQCFTPLAALNRSNGHEPRYGNLIPEFERIVNECRPRWFVMENVQQAPEPNVPGYKTHTQRLNNRWLGETQNRMRLICFGTMDGRYLNIETVALEQPMIMRTVSSNVGGSKSAVKVLRGMPAVTSSDGGKSVRMWRYSVEEATELQGLPKGFLSDTPFTREGKLRAIANGVPLPMGRAIARAIKRALEDK